MMRRSASNACAAKDCNEQPAVPTRAGVLPFGKTADTKTSPPAAADTADYEVHACTTCATRARTARLKWIAEHPQPSASTDGAHHPYEAQRGISSTEAKNAKQASLIVDRVAPEPSIHASANELQAQRTHNPYSSAWVQCWDGKCNGQDICKMLGAEYCICSLTEDVPKDQVACLDWVNCGVCDPTKRGLTECPYAHPDLTKVHPDICCNYYLTGICRFGKTADDVAATAPADGQKKKRRVPCRRCHCVAPKDGVFPLLPGLTKKILRPLRSEGSGVDRKVVEWDRTDLDRALALYKAFLGREEVQTH